MRRRKINVKILLPGQQEEQERVVAFKNFLFSVKSSRDENQFQSLKEFIPELFSLEILTIFDFFCRSNLHLQLT